jgi:hypothetical protein
MSSLRKSQKAVAEADLLEEQNRLARRAYDMRQQGRSWWDIAEELGISEQLAQRRVDEAIARASQLIDDYTKRSMLAMEIGRLDRLQQAFWDDAIGGDVRSAEFILKVSAQRTKLLGLDDMTSNQQTISTVIVQGTSNEYIEALRVASRKELTGDDDK